MLLAVAREGGEHGQAALEPGVAQPSPRHTQCEKQTCILPASTSSKERKRKENPPLIFPHQFNQTSFQISDTAIL